jgi:hypothetical protein
LYASSMMTFETTSVMSPTSTNGIFAASIGNARTSSKIKSKNTPSLKFWLG